MTNALVEVVRNLRFAVEECTENKEKYYIYVFVCSITQKVYIGQTNNLNRRENEYSLYHCTRQPKLYNALLKYGFDNFIFYCIRECQTFEDAIYWESYYINSYDSVNLGYNLTYGGEGTSWSDESKLKLSKTKTEYYKTHIHHRKGSNLTEAHKLKISQGNLGKKRTPEQKQKYSDIFKKVNKNGNSKTWRKGHVPWNKNKSVSIITKNKIRLAKFKDRIEKYGFIGIFPYKRSKNSPQKWIVRLFKQSKIVASKVFNDKIDAAKWYDEKAIENFGEDAITNAKLLLYNL